MAHSLSVQRAQSITPDPRPHQTQAQPPANQQVQAQQAQVQQTQRNQAAREQGIGVNINRLA